MQPLFFLHVFEELENKQNKDEEIALFQINLELPLGGNCINLKDKHDQTFTDPTNEGSGASITFMDE